MGSSNANLYPEGVWQLIKPKKRKFLKKVSARILSVPSLTAIDVRVARRDARDKVKELPSPPRRPRRKNPTSDDKGALSGTLLHARFMSRTFSVGAEKASKPRAVA